MSLLDFICNCWCDYDKMEISMNNILKEQNIQGNRNHKDSLFRMVFKKKEDLLELYNAINGTNYTNAEELEVNTLENALYMGIKNDISFLIGYTMNLYEHQSSQSANMPVRGLIYLTRQFENYIANIRKYQKDKRLTLTEAITRAIDECIEKGILKDILIKQRNEVFSVILSTFDKELYEKDLKEEAYEEGYDKGAYDKLCKQVKRKLEKDKSVEQIADELEETVEAINEILKEMENVKE